MDTYYRNQAGSGLSPFVGVRFQKGHGFFGRLIKGTVFPLLKQLLPYLGKKALNTGINVAGDYLNRKSNLKDAFKSNLKKTALDIADEALTKVRGQRGEGMKRKSSRRKVSNKKKTSSKRKKRAVNSLMKSLLLNKPRRKRSTKRKGTKRRTGKTAKKELGFLD